MISVSICATYRALAMDEGLIDSMIDKHPKGRAIFHAHCMFLNSASSIEKNMEYIRFPGSNHFLFAVSRDCTQWKMVAAMAGLQRNSLVTVRGAEILTEIERFNAHF